MKNVEEVIEVHPQKCASCLSCQLICSFSFTKAFNPLKAWINIDWMREGVNKITFSDDCKACGLCADYCAYGALIRLK